MILGFAHITRNVRNGTLQVDPVPSAPEKWPLMSRQATSHRIGFEGPTRQIELVEYDTDLIERRSRLGLLTTAVSMGIRSLMTECSFFSGGLGFDWVSGPSGGTLRITGLPNWELSILPFVEPDAPIDPPLDIAGYAAIAFYSSDVEADRDHLLKHGGRTPTEPFTVELDRKMKIVMLRSPEGTIIELIQVVK
jgi:hypothetical protein